MTTHPVCKLRRLGRIDYSDALAMQEGMVRLRREGKIPDTLLLLEHPHVVTLGSGSDEAHVLVDAAQQELLGLSVHQSTRGGDVTYHGPGQIVGYPVCQLSEEERDAHDYLRRLEEVLIRTVADFGIEAKRHPEYTGVWVGDYKIAAIGVRLTRWITSHGFALNVDPDLSYFDTIVPCGIAEKQVSSMRKLLGRRLDLNAVETRIAHHFGQVFGRKMVESGVSVSPEPIDDSDAATANAIPPAGES